MSPPLLHQTPDFPADETFLKLSEHIYYFIINRFLLFSVSSVVNLLFWFTDLNLPAVFFVFLIFNERLLFFDFNLSNHYILPEIFFMSSSFVIFFLQNFLKFFLKPVSPFYSLGFTVSTYFVFLFMLTSSYRHFASEL